MLAGGDAMQAGAFQMQVSTANAVLRVVSLFWLHSFLGTYQFCEADARTVFEKAAGAAPDLEGMNSRKNRSKTVICESLKTARSLPCFEFRFYDDPRLKIKASKQLLKRFFGIYRELG